MIFLIYKNLSWKGPNTLNKLFVDTNHWKYVFGYCLHTVLMYLSSPAVSCVKLGFESFFCVLYLFREKYTVCLKVFNIIFVIFNFDNVLGNSHFIILCMFWRFESFVSRTWVELRNLDISIFGRFRTATGTNYLTTEIYGCLTLTQQH